MDRGWNVAAAASLTAFFTVVMMMNSGFFYVSFLEEFHVDRKSASWPISIISIVSHSSCLLVSFGQRHLSVFQLGLIGSVFLWAGILGAVFAPNMHWMTVTLGGVHGVGLGIVCVTLIVVVMVHFDKYRGIASGLKFAGYTLCSLLFPKILTSLKKAYGFRGCLLIYAALTMNVTALSLVLKEPPRETRVRKARAECKPSTPEDDAKEKAFNKEAAQDGAVATVTHISEVSYLVCHQCSHLLNSATGVAEKRNINVKHIPGNKSASGAVDCGWCGNKNNVAIVTATRAQPTLHSADPAGQLRPLTLLGEQSRRSTELILKDSRAVQQAVPGPNTVNENTRAASRVSEPLFTDEPQSPSPFKNILFLLSQPRFYVFVLAIVAVDYTMAVFPATIVDYALDKGSPRNHADLSVTYCAPAEIVGRIALPLIGDYGVVSRTTLVSVSYFLLGVTMFALPATSSFVPYILVCACATMMIGCLISMKPVVIADHFGVESVAAGYGIAGVTLVPLVLCSPTIIGYFRDTKGNYDGLCQLQAGIHCCVGAAFGVLAILDRRRRKIWCVT